MNNMAVTNTTYAVAHDMRLNDLLVEFAKADRARTQAVDTMHYALNHKRTRLGGWSESFADTRTAVLAKGEERAMSYSCTFGDLHERYATAHNAALAAKTAVDEHEANYTGWARFFHVTNVGGHTHSSRSCSTCRPTTEFAFRPELSGQDEAAAVEAVGPVLCSVCFPSAPVEWTNGESNQVVADREFTKAMKELAASAEFKAMKTKTTLVERKAYRVEDLERRVARANDTFSGGAPEFVVRDAETSEKELPKARKQLAAAQAKLDEATRAFEAALEG